MQRNAKGRFLKKEFSLPTLDELNHQTQLVCPGYIPFRTLKPDPSLEPNERIRKAKELALLYQKIGEPIPVALLALI